MTEQIALVNKTTIFIKEDNSRAVINYASVASLKCKNDETI